MKLALGLVLLAFGTLAATSQSKKKTGPPNVLLIAIDDLNDWVACLGGHPDAKTPNLDLPNQGTSSGVRRTPTSMQHSDRSNNEKQRHGGFGNDTNFVEGEREFLGGSFKFKMHSPKCTEIGAT